MNESRDLYAVLEVSRTASEDDLKKAYRRLAKKYHPDVCPGDKQAEERFKEAASAYQILSDKEQRATYDRHGLDGLRRGAPSGAESPFEGFRNVEDIFSRFGVLFGDFFTGRTTRTPRGADIHLDLHLTFNEAVWGTRKDMKFSRAASCDTCHGTGAGGNGRTEICRHCQGKGQIIHAQGFFMVQTTCAPCQGRGKLISNPCTPCQGRGLKHETSTVALTIPPGVNDKQTLRITNKGEHAAGGTSGDLYVTLHVAEDRRFTRRGADILSEVFISFPQAVLGGEITIDTLDEGCHGSTILELPPGTQPGDSVTRLGEGVPHLNGDGRGDHLITFHIEVPRKLTARQEKLLREFATALDEESQRPRKKRPG